jgi:DNA-binding transcriptional LysR family regulator
LPARAAEIRRGQHIDFDWNDLRHFLAVARHGSTLAASRALSVDQSTVQRRVAELERRLGRALVKRETAGYRLTEFGRAMLASAESVEQAVLALEQTVTAQLRAAESIVRVTCPEPIVLRLKTSGLIDRFRSRHPDIQVQFVMSDRYLDLMKGEADVALRSGDTDDGALIGRKIADSVWAIYGSPGYLADRAAPEHIGQLRSHPMITFDESMGGHRVATWLRRVAPDATISARSNSVLGLVYSAKSGMGLAPLPVSIGDAEPDLVRVLGPIDDLTRIWRVLVAPDMRHAPHIAAFFDFIVDEIDALRPILTG